MFNYIMFIAYLRKKNPIDYTGAESYVFDSYVEHNLQWFPIYKVFRVNSRTSQLNDGQT